MADLFHLWQNDLVASATGDLLTADGTTLGKQRVLRRLLTNKGTYIWHPEYGASLPSLVGNGADAASLTGIIRSQIYLEPAVSQRPEPSISVQVLTDGSVYIAILYVDASSGQQTSLAFDITV